MASVYDREWRAKHANVVMALAETCAVSVRERLAPEIDADTLDRISVSVDVWLDGVKILTKEADLCDLPVVTKPPADATPFDSPRMQQVGRIERAPKAVL